MYAYTIYVVICASGQSIEERHHYNHYPAVAGRSLVSYCANPFMYVFPLLTSVLRCCWLVIVKGKWPVNNIAQHPKRLPRDQPHPGEHGKIGQLFKSLEYDDVYEGGFKEIGINHMNYLQFIIIIIIIVNL